MNYQTKKKKKKKSCRTRRCIRRLQASIIACSQELHLENAILYGAISHKSANLRPTALRSALHDQEFEPAPCITALQV